VAYAPKNFSPFCRKKQVVRERRELVAKRRRYDRQRDPQIKRLYNRVRWKRLRLRRLEADGWLCQNCLNVHGRERAGSVVDHIVPHKGDLNLFYSFLNTQALCPECHNSKTAGQDGGLGNPIRSPRR